MVLVPVVLAKLWSVIPKLFVWPPVRSPAQALERASLLLLVGSTLFEIVTGLLNIQYDYVFGFSFYTGHYLGAWVFVAAFVAHVALKLPHMVRGLRSRSLRAELRHTARRAPCPRPPDEAGLVAPDPAPPTMSRRGALALVGGGVALLAALSIGQMLGGPARATRVAAAPRAHHRATGRTDSRSTAPRRPPGSTSPPAGLAARARRCDARGRSPAPSSPRCRCTPPGCRSPASRAGRRVQTWTGVRLRDLAALAGVPQPASAFVASLEDGPFAQGTLTAGQVLDPDALLALRVNGVDLSLDHGFPARIIVPALPGVHCTKWVRSIEFREA